MAEEAKKTWDTGLLDGVIARANEEKRGMWVGTLCRHAAVLTHAIGDIRREIQYAEQALPHADNQRFAFYNFARLLLRAGEAARAERYAEEAYKLAVAQGTEADSDLVVAIRKQWPNLSDGS